MSAAAAESVEDGDAPLPRPKGKKKLIILIAAALLVVAGAGGGGAFFLKKKRDAAAAAAEAGEEGEISPSAKAAPRKRSHNGPPAFLPLDAFVVNLADRDTERFAQIGITLELNDPKHADQMKAYMPAIRNGILMVLAHKSAAELLSRAGKERLAIEIMHAVVLPLGIELEIEGADPTAADEGQSTEKTPIEDSPIRNVHFSSFIIQ